MVEAGESEYSGALKTRNLLILGDAKNARIAEIAPNWNVSGREFFGYQAKFRSAALQFVVAEGLPTSHSQCGGARSEESNAKQVCS